MLHKAESMTIAINEYENMCNDAVGVPSLLYALWKYLEDLRLAEPIAAQSFETRAFGSCI